MAGTVGDTAGQIAGTLQQTAQGALEQTRQMSSQARWQIEQILDENRLAVGAVAVAAGAAIGMLLPATRPEEQLLGEPSRQVTQAAQQAASDDGQGQAGDRQRAGSGDRGGTPAGAHRPTAARRGGRAGRAFPRPLMATMG
ncbi:MAG: hypothetical protein DLM71_01830 [Chloroflexi bacterium]|nr:MAG: hypothetical protein DLM71_01830 [Chloroflexota bacterium]